MSDPLWTFEDLLRAMKGRPIGPTPGAVNGISIDSRTIKPGEAFFAIRGETFDGHDFAGRALSAGAATAVVSEERLSSLGRVSGSLVVVTDVLAALEALGRASRARSPARIAAVTGSVGKTGTKEMLALALKPEGEVHYSPASFNNHWGVPLSLARMPASARFGIFEIGMNHAGEIEPLTKLVEPHVAIVTTVEPVHLEFFESVADIARAKAEIFLGLVPDGVAVINRDNPYADLLIGEARMAGVRRIVTFGESKEADARLDVVKLKPECSCVSAEILGEKLTYKLGAPGRHLVQNSLAVLSAVVLMGGDLAAATLALGHMSAPKGRGARLRLALPTGGKATLIDESYNANPASMRAAIAILGQAEPGKEGRRIAVLGDMRELGAAAEELHAGLAQDLVAARVDSVFLAGPLMRALHDALPAVLRGGYAETAADLEPMVAQRIERGDVIMVKGSNASRMWGLVESLKARFSAQAESDLRQDVA
ncbi:MAG TPA: UDP-N-acetylmuramoylalanyl-D-glutamyl-2,6-diaminopimelate--D-alanyl-D-alanine ligase [Bauldia sp.]|nr:UDP-N-acetylmuramoylalanyl-D-glutamyl-2,6-diaminopimelate--D-alanyl-D-alanine ligase [Bauldia sp.]